MDVLTIDEIKARYPLRWVLIADCQTDEYQRLLAGTVLYDGPTRDEVDEKLLELRPSHFAVRYTGPFPKDLVLVL